MKHIALRSRSMRAGIRPYTAPGLGDRVHSVYLAYQYGLSHNSPVTIHLTDDKWSVAGGVQSDKKKKSWPEIINLFPKDSLFIQPHPVENLPEDEWINYLADKGIVAETYYYSDCFKMHPNVYEMPFAFDASKVLSNEILLQADDCAQDLQLPNKFVTAQWDSTDPQRTLSPLVIDSIHNKYRSQGCEVVVIGGESKNDLLKNSLKHIGYAMSKSEAHIGGDSGFLHMALLYHKFENIHLYNKINGYFSHHAYRAKLNGCKTFNI